MTPPSKAVGFSFNFEELVRKANEWLSKARNAPYSAFWRRVKEYYEGWGEIEVPEPTEFEEEGEEISEELSKAIKEIEEYVIKHGITQNPLVISKGQPKFLEPEDIQKEYPNAIVVQTEGTWYKTAENEPYGVSFSYKIIIDENLAKAYRKLKELHSEIDWILTENRPIE